MSQGLWREAQFLVHMYLADVSIRRNLGTNRQHVNCTRSEAFSQARKNTLYGCKYFIFFMLSGVLGLHVENKKGAPKSAFQIEISLSNGRLQMRMGMMM